MDEVPQLIAKGAAMKIEKLEGIEEEVSLGKKRKNTKLEHPKVGNKRMHMENIMQYIQE